MNKDDWFEIMVVTGSALLLLAMLIYIVITSPYVDLAWGLIAVCVVLIVLVALSVIRRLR